MMNAQLTSPPPRHGADDLRVLHGGRVLPLGAGGGRLEVLHGRVWLTRAGDLDDHFVDFGQSVVVPASARALVEALDDAEPAVVAWHPRTIAERIGAALHASFDRCWEIVEPGRRIGVGTAAAALALAIGALVFGPLSDARTRSLAEASLLHNSAGPAARASADGRSIPRGARADVGAESRERARSPAQEARRRTTGVA